MTQVTRFGGVIPVLTSGAVGYDPGEVANSEDVPDPVDVAIDTTGSIAEVPVAISGSVTLVQSIGASSANSAATVTATFASPPTTGNLLIAVMTSRSNSAPVPISGGWTQIESTVHTNPGSNGGDQVLYYRIAGTSEPSAVTFEAHNYKRLVIMEISGGLDYDVSTSLTNQSNASPETVGPITPAAGLPAVIVGAFQAAAGSGSYTQGSGYTLIDADTSDGFGPRLLVEYKIVATTSGTYSATGTFSVSAEWAGFAASFVSSFDVIWVSAPETIDGNDATYDAVATATIDDSIWRIQLSDPAKIAHVVAKIGASASGAQSSDLYGATLPDFSDEALLATRAWTATGSYTSNTIEFLPPGTSAYQYYRLSGPDDVRIYTVEMYPPQVLTSVDTSGFELKTEGGQSTIQAHGAMGSTETFVPADGNVHTGTFTADCTFSLTAPTGSGACVLELYLSQDSTGGWVATWPGSVTLVGTLDLTADTTSIVILQSLDGGTSWTALVAGGSGSVPNIEDLSTAETDTTLVYAPDGAGGVVARAETGGAPDAIDVAYDDSTSGLTSFDVQAAIDELADGLSFGVSSVGSLTAGGSPQTVQDDATWNEFPGLVRLDPDRVLAVYRGNGTDHITDGQICGQIGTLSATRDSVTWGAKFTILDDALDLRCEDGVSIVDGQLVIAYRKYTGTANTSPNIIICDDAPEDFTSASTWGAAISIPLTTGSVQNYTNGHVHKVGSTYVLGVGWQSAGTHTVGIATWTAALNDPSGATFTTIGSGATDYAEIAFNAMADGVTYRAHMRTASGTLHYESHSTSLTSGWSGPASMFTAEGYPMWRVLLSGLALTVYRHSANGDNEWRQATDDTDATWSSTTILDTTGTRSAYATLLQVTPTKVLCLYGVEYSSGGTTGTADIFAQWFTDSSTFAAVTPAPANATYLTTTSNGTLSAEVVVGTTPGGELGGTWASPTVDATHAGSTHVALSSATPLVESGSGSAGSGTAASKDDHVHPVNSSGAAHYLVVASSHSTPLIFGDLVQTSDGSDLIYTS